MISYISEQSKQEHSKMLSQRLLKTKEVKLQFMDDFCKQTNIFTNKDDALKH